MNSLVFASFSMMNLLILEWLYGGGLVQGPSINDFAYVHLFPTAHCVHFGSWKKTRYANIILVTVSTNQHLVCEYSVHLIFMNVSLVQCTSTYHTYKREEGNSKKAGILSPSAGKRDLATYLPSFPAGPKVNLIKSQEYAPFEST